MLVTVNLNLTRINECVSEVSGSKSGSNENGNGSEVVPGALKSGSTTSKISGNPECEGLDLPGENRSSGGEGVCRFNKITYKYTPLMFLHAV